jgi:hypothetical protein
VPSRYTGNPCFFLIQSANQEQINCTQEVLSQGAILRRLGNFWVNRLREVLVEHLLPVGLVLAKEHIAELCKTCDLIQVQFFQCVDELRDRLAESKLNSKLAVILMDLSLVLVTRIVLLQLVNIGEHCLSVPPVLKHKKGLFL